MLNEQLNLLKGSWMLVVSFHFVRRLISDFIIFTAAFSAFRRLVELSFAFEDFAPDARTAMLQNAENEFADAIHISKSKGGFFPSRTLLMQS